MRNLGRLSAAGLASNADHGNVRTLKKLVEFLLVNCNWQFQSFLEQLVVSRRVRIPSQRVDQVLTVFADPVAFSLKKVI